MKCSRCGRSSEFLLKTEIDGIEKRISFCKNCLIETLKFDTTNYTKAGVELLASHVEFAEEIKTNSDIFISNNLEILTLMPIAIQSALFKGDEFSKSRTLKEINIRQIYFLKQRLKKALRNENYELANALKKQIKHLENMSEI